MEIYFFIIEAHQKAITAPIDFSPKIFLKSFFGN
jgi:hypothetical protein